MTTRLYSHLHLKRIGLLKEAQQTLQKVEPENWGGKGDDYYLPTNEFVKKVKQYNLMAILKDIKPAKPVYKWTCINNNTKRMCWYS
jgi:hypothetical protein